MKQLIVIVTQRMMIFSNPERLLSFSRLPTFYVFHDSATETMPQFNHYHATREQCKANLLISHEQQSNQNPPYP